MIRFAPYYQPVLWGGRRLADRFGRALPEGKIGESWELVELPKQHSTATGGAHHGKKLGDLWRQGVLGGRAQGEFPFLLKWIDAADILSVQVHPDEAAVARMGTGRPKTEAWYVVDVEPGASLLMGHHAGLDANTLKQAVEHNTLSKWLHEVHPKPYEIYFLKAGVVHAIGKGMMLLEVQQPSDTTFRIFDFGRVGQDGKLRQLHLDEAMACIDYRKSGAVKAVRDSVVGPCFSLRTMQDGQIISEPARLRAFVADKGPVTLVHTRGQEHLRQGDTIVAEPQDGDVAIMGGSAVYLTDPVF